jgi:hypothetical protein
VTLVHRQDCRSLPFGCNLTTTYFVAMSLTSASPKKWSDIHPCDKCSQSGHELTLAQRSLRDERTKKQFNYMSRSDELTDQRNNLDQKKTPFNSKLNCLTYYLHSPLPTPNRTV